jgi:hypothetical protein
MQLCWQPRVTSYLLKKDFTGFYNQLSEQIRQHGIIHCKNVTFINVKTALRKKRPGTVVRR